MATLGMPLLGMGQETPTLTSLLTARREREKQSKLADLLANAYGSQDQAQRQGYITDAIRTDPAQGMTLARMLDPRLSGSGGKPAQQQYAEWLLSQVPADQRDQVLGVLAGYKARLSSASLIYRDGEDEYGNPITRAFDPNNVGGTVLGTGQSYGAPVGTGMRGGGQQQPMQAPVDQRQPEALGGQLFAGLGQIPGIQVTSGLRTPERNAQVGGVPNSYHLTGQARDIAPPSTPQAAQQVRQYAAQHGLEIIDEGDHWHLEPAPRSGAQQAAPQAIPQPAGGFMGRRKEDEAAAVEAARQRAQMQYLPAQEQIKTQAAIDQARGVAQANADVARDVQAPKRRENFRLAQEGIQNTINAIDGAINRVDWTTAGPIGAATRGIWGTPAYGLARAAATVKANIGFDRLQQMRDASPTGGALGQVAIQELEALQASIASLDQGLPPSELEANLKTVRRHYQNWLNAARQAEQADFGGQRSASPQQPAGGGSRSAPPALPAGFTWSNN